jgi:hypothetical protein
MIEKHQFKSNVEEAYSERRVSTDTYEVRSKEYIANKSKIIITNAKTGIFD